MTCTSGDEILLLDLGHKNVKVYSPFSVGILATGTEIYEGKHEDLDSAMLGGLVTSWGGCPTYEGSVPDQYEIVEKRIEELSKKYDVVITLKKGDNKKKIHSTHPLHRISLDIKQIQRNTIR